MDNGSKIMDMEFTIIKVGAKLEGALYTHVEHLIVARLSYRKNVICVGWYEVTGSNSFFCPLFIFFPILLFFLFYVPATLPVHMDAADSALPATQSQRSQSSDWTGRTQAAERTTAMASANFFKTPQEKSPGYS